MQVFIDVDLHQAVQGVGSRSPAAAITIKNQDTQSLNVYFVSSGVVQDFGAGAAIKFGLNLPAPAAISLMVLDATFSRMTDALGNVFYQGFPIFNTTQLAAALGVLGSINCSGEIRYQLTDGEVIHTLDIPFVVYRTILSEISTDATTANFTVPAIGSNVTISIGNTNWLASLIGQNVSISTAGVYQVISITNATQFVAQNTGTTGNAVATTVITFPQTVGTTAPSVPSTYPDVSTIELKVNKGVASGYAGLDSGGKILASVVPASVISTCELTANKDAANGYPGLDASGLILFDDLPIDGTSIVSAGGKISAIGPALGVLSVTTGGFTVPAVGANVSIACPTASLTALNFYNISTAGAYQLISITDTQHGLFQNISTPGNAAPAAVISFGQSVTFSGVIGSTGAAGAAGPTGPSSPYRTTFSAFTVPAANATVNVTVASATDFVAGQRHVLTDGTLFIWASVTTIASLVITYTNLLTPGGSVSGSMGAGRVYMADGGATLTDAETSAGVTLLGTSPGQIKRIIAGTNLTLDTSTTPGGVILNSSGGSGTSIHASITKSTAWTYSDTSPIPFDTAISDSTGMWPGGSSTKLVCATAGYYLLTVILHVAWTATPGITNFVVCINGYSGGKLAQSVVGSASLAQIICISGRLKLAASDYVEVYPTGVSGTNPSAINHVASGSATPQSPFFALDYLGT